MRSIFLFFCLLFFISADAQELTGIWRGHFRTNDEFQRLIGGDDRYKFEVQIAQRDNNFQAITYSYKTTVFYGKADAMGTVNPKTKKILLKELKLLEVRMLGGDACNMTCFLKYSRLGDEEFLEGTFTSNNIRDSSDCGKGTIFLHRVIESDFFKEPFLVKREKEIETGKKKESIVENKKRTSPPSADSALRKMTAAKKVTNTPPSKPVASLKKPNLKPAKLNSAKNDLVKTNPGGESIATIKKDSIGKIELKKMSGPVPRVIATRANELVQSIIVNTQEIELNIYDNGTIDNDTVSVYFDKKLIVSNARLTAKAIVVKLHLENPDEEHELTMVAENEGEIPPNTSLMVVKAGEKQFEVHITSTEQKNAVVVFKYEKSK